MGAPKHRDKRGWPVAHTLETIFAKCMTVPFSGCWVWMGGDNGKPDAHGRTKYRGTMVYVHRLAYTLAKGPIPSKRVVDHLCRVRLCCNPDHLEAVTQFENISRGENFLADVLKPLANPPAVEEDYDPNFDPFELTD